MSLEPLATEQAEDPLDDISARLRQIKVELESVSDPSRERSLAITKIDEARLWIGEMP